MGPVCIAVGVVFATLLFWFLAQRARTFALFKRLGIPGRPPCFIFGNHQELQDKGMAATFDNWITKYGDIVGIDAVATPLSFATYLLACHQDVQDRLREEVHLAIKRDGEITYKNVCAMEYLGQVISETLRMFPPLDGFDQRAFDEDYEYKGVRFPKGTLIGAAVLRMHYDPRFWNEPEKFDPDRFSKENKLSVNPMTYLPFGAGPRNCIAARYSELLMRFSLATLTSRIKLSPNEVEHKTNGSFRANFILMVRDKGSWLRVDKIPSV